MSEQNEIQEPEYILEKWKHGWLVKAPRFRGGVPMHCLQEIMPLMPKGAIVDGSICTALKAVFAIGTEKECKIWREEIETHLEKTVKDPYRRWMLGTDTGLSSLCMLSEMIDNPGLRLEVLTLIPDGSHVPRDSSDFGRCYRMLQKFPELAKLENWKKLVEKHPAWRPYADNWSELEAAWNAKQYVKINAMFDRFANERKST